MVRKNMMINQLNMMLWDLPSPSSINYFWNFGSSLGFIMTFQILTGLFLSFHYTSFSLESFDSLFKIMREVWGGWMIRFLHMNGSSIFFFFIYMHLFRGLFFFSFLNKNLWMSGVTIFIILMSISFLGYVLPWGQMSFWGVAVITNLFSIIPIFGGDLVYLMWGGFSVSSPTLIRFYSLHFLLPFILMFTVMIHLILLHQNGSSNPLGIKSSVDKIMFHPFFSIKDIYFFMILLMLFLMLVFFFPYMLGDPVNNIPSMPLLTPIHIQPEWYFLSSYAILRSFSSKIMGVLFLFLSVSIFYIIPIFKFKFSIYFNKLHFLMFFFYFFNFLVLMKFGSLPAEEPYVQISKILTMSYFSFIFLMLV